MNPGGQSYAFKTLPSSFLSSCHICRETFFFDFENILTLVLSQRLYTVKLGYNKLGYNEHAVIKNKYLGLVLANIIKFFFFVKRNEKWRKYLFYEQKQVELTEIFFPTKLCVLSYLHRFCISCYNKYRIYSRISREILDRFRPKYYQFDLYTGRL